MDLKLSPRVSGMMSHVRGDVSATQSDFAIQARHARMVPRKDADLTRLSRWTITCSIPHSWRRDREASGRRQVDPVDTSELPPVLAKLLTPWARAIEISGPGLGAHVTATAAYSFSALRRRIVLTPPLERAFADARLATDSLASAVDRRRSVPFWTRAAARSALAELATQLRGAEPDALTRELGLGW